MTRVRPVLEVELSGFKGIVSAKIRLGQLTVLTGTNSSGKSSILQALALLQQSSNAQGFVLNGSLVELGAFHDVLHDKLIRGSREVTAVEIRLRSRQGVKRAYSGEAESTADFVPLAAGSSDLSDLPWEHLEYLRADRIGPTLVHRTSHTSVVRERTVGAYGEFAVHYLISRAAQDVLTPLCLETPGHSLEEQANAWMEKIANGTRIYPSSLGGTSASVLRFSNGATSGLSAGHQHRATNVGFGLSYVLPIVVACLGARPGDLIMIENPEAHLHPRAQSSIASLCARAAAAGAQVIVETHSDHVVNAVRVAVGEKVLTPNDVCIYFFDRSTSQIAKIERLQIDGAGQITRWPPGFFDENLKLLLRLRELGTSG